MNYTTLSNFLNNAENIINNTIINEEHTTIKTEEGNVVLLTEQQYNCLIEAMRRNRHWNREPLWTLYIITYPIIPLPVQMSVLFQK